MDFKEKILTKSNSYNYYKKKNIELTQEIDSLKKEIETLKRDRQRTLRDEYIKSYGNAGSFCNWTYVDYYFRDDFEDKFKAVTGNLKGEAKNVYKWIFLRALAVNLISRNSLYFDREVEAQKKFKDFREENSAKNEIAGFKFSGDYNLHAFIDLGLNDEDLKFLKNKDIIDAGAFTGDTSLPLSQITSKKVYAFEPFSSSFNLLKKNIKDNNIKNIIPVNKSLGDTDGERTLYLAGENYQGITSNPDTRAYDSEIKVREITLDTYVEENDLDVGLISIDVEGSERALLKGGVETVKSQKPILNISIYHSVKDFFEIIPWVADLDLGYEFRVFKEQPWPFLADTVVQCRVK